MYLLVDQGKRTVQCFINFLSNKNKSVGNIPSQFEVHETCSSFRERVALEYNSNPGLNLKVVRIMGNQWAPAKMIYTCSICSPVCCMYINYHGAIIAEGSFGPVLKCWNRN